MIEQSQASAAQRTPLVVIAGNPNVGKTTVFNRLTGADLKVGNYAGVTVELFTGKLTLPAGGSVRLMDVPGTYSLSARSEDEQVAMKAVTGMQPLESPDLIVVVVDATQLSRNLYLVLQVIETDLPVVVAVSMLDMLERRGHTVDLTALEHELGVPVVATCGLERNGTEELRKAIGRVLQSPSRGRPGWRWEPSGPGLLEDIENVSKALPAEWANGHDKRRRAIALWALLSIGDDDELADISADLRTAVRERRRQAEGNQRQIDTEVIQGRYDWIDQRIPKLLREPEDEKPTRTERIDDVLLNPVIGFFFFLLVMGVIFQSLFSWADPMIGVIEDFFGLLAGLTENTLGPSILRDFIVGGLIQGVGSVIVFLPQILMLFFFIGLMEDTGYMARVAFLMDRIMKMIGLHGRAFVPMLSGFACAIPAIMATRTMERRRDRMLTMMVVPLMTCSARLPVYLLVIAALYPPSRVFGLVPVQGLLMISMYLFSTVTALLAAAVLGRTLFKGPRVPLILELPRYRMPNWPSVVRLMWQRSSLFLRDAGGIILLCTIGLWLLLSFPRNPELSTDYAALRAGIESAELSDEQRDQRLARVDTEEAGEKLQASYGGRLGRLIEPTIEPLGFDWKIGVGLIGAFAAREVFISTMGIVYGLGKEADEDSVSLREKIRSETHHDGKPVYTPLVGLSLMVFFALACQCMSTLAVVYRETKSWGWPVFLFTYMTVLAWIASFVVYQGGKLIGFS